MDMISVVSTQIEKIGYDAESQTLRVLFKKGGLYDYSNVPADVANTFIGSDSPGKYLQSNIRGVYAYEKVA